MLDGRAWRELNGDEAVRKVDNGDFFEFYKYIYIFVLVGFFLEILSGWKKRTFSIKITFDPRVVNI